MLIFFLSILLQLPDSNVTSNMKMLSYLHDLLTGLLGPYWELLLYANGYGPAFLQSDWLIASPYNTIRTTFFNFCRKSSTFQVSVVLASEIVKL